VQSTIPTSNTVRASPVSDGAVISLEPSADDDAAPSIAVTVVVDAATVAPVGFELWIATSTCCNDDEEGDTDGDDTQTLQRELGRLFHCLELYSLRSRDTEHETQT